MDKIKINPKVLPISDDNFCVIINRNDPIELMRGAAMYCKNDASNTWPLKMEGRSDEQIIEEAEAIYIIKNLSKLK